MGYIDKMQQYGFIPADHDKPNHFPVELVPMTAGGFTVDGWKALIRPDTGQVLHCWQDGYNLVPPEAATAAFDQAIDASGLDTKGLMVATDLTHDGKRLFRQ